MRKWFWAMGALVVVLLVALGLQVIRPAGCKPVDAATLTPAQAQQALGERAKAAVGALQSKDWEKLSTMVHPEKGVRFSPYAHVGPTDLVFTAGQLKTLYADKRLYEWGTFDGSGEPIRLSFADYYQRFVYDADFAAAPKVAYNEALGKGNTINN